MNKVVFLFLISIVSFSQDLEIIIDVDSLYYKNTKHGISNNLPLIIKGKNVCKTMIFPLVFEDFNFVFDEKYDETNIKRIVNEEEFFLPFLFIEDDDGKLIKFNVDPPPYTIPLVNIDKSSNYNVVELNNNKYTNISKIINLPLNIRQDGSKLNYIFDKSKKYHLWIEFYFTKVFYEKNFSKEQISKWEKEGYELFTGTLKSNKVRIYNIEELICK